jgi:23S rRNA (cytidine1920-2'-O)/16S rRNA (cytidine1409-2'-O)-methyltransferase
MGQRLDKELVNRNLSTTRSQADNLIKMGRVSVDNWIITKSSHVVNSSNAIRVIGGDQYVSRAAYKLESVTTKLDLDFKHKVVLDVGSSTGGFTDYALRSGAKKVIAIDVGTDQLHPSLRGDERIELREKTDIRDVKGPLSSVDIVLIDVSFISLREVLPHISKIVTKPAVQIVAMVKPQFETGQKTKNKGIIKNDKMRREILKNFESWVMTYFVIINKADSEISGAKGNRERFYCLKKL